MIFLVKGVGDVSCPASKKVPIAIAIANTINKMPVRRLEKSIFLGGKKILDNTCITISGNLVNKDKFFNWEIKKKI